MRKFSVTLRQTLFAAMGLCSIFPAFSSLAAGGSLVAIVQPEPVALNTAFNTNFPNGVVSNNIYEGLVTYNQDMQPEPSLATSWEVAPDGLSITFHLRHGVKWHDGQPFTSADVKYSALELWKKVHPRGRTTFAALKDVETPDAYTAIFRLEHPSLVIMSSINANEAEILPEHLFAGSDIRTSPYNAKPVGTGPFKFVKWVRGQYIELERNPDYWDSGKPKVDKVIFSIIPDAGSRAAALETGEALYAPYDSVPLSDVQRLRQNPQLVVTKQGYDSSAAYTFLEFNLRNPILANLKVRQAIARAINKQALVDVVWYGLGKPATGPIPSSLKQFYTADGVPQYPYDHAAAERLLDEAGYPRKTGGIRFKLAIDYFPVNDGFKNQAEFIRQSLSKIGIELTVRNQDLATFIKRIYSDYDFDIETGRWVPMMDPQIGGLRHYWSKNIAKGTPWSNASNYTNPKMDALIASLQVESDPTKRADEFHQFQRLAQTDLPVIPLVEQQNFTVYSARLKGVSTAPDGALSSLKDVSLEPGGK
ncbi:ABC transporter substrate-binding protein [Sodalis ligni]|uniref:ABC transporter substrate-binding protein n=1 Tax=Sodalis ligni TaxID=2697027 RepID=UPI00193ECF6F|nr:ABC transporter substrate-binding protein [Sodalis ligni]QWA11389.1 ABC transporter substrate-binding protein [Sodalis ligni]